MAKSPRQSQAGMNAHLYSHDVSPTKKNIKAWLLAAVFLGSLPIIAIVLPIASSWISVKEEQSRRSTSEERLTEIGEALLAYRGEHQSFPPAYITDEQGKPLHSWRTLILPHLGHGELFERIDLTKPWDDPTNQEAASETISVYQCASADLDPVLTTFVAVIDPQGIMPGILPTQLSQIHDGLALTLIATETNASNAVHWMSPQDISFATYTQADDTPEIVSPHFNGHHILLADGTVMFSVEGSQPDLRTSFITMNAGDDPLSSMLGLGSGLSSPLTSAQGSTQTSISKNQYELGIKILREITPANREQKIAIAMEAFKRSAIQGNGDAARQLANLSKTQAEQYAWFSVAAQNQRDLRSPFQAFQKLLVKSSSYDALASQYIQKYGRGSPSTVSAGKVLTNGADEYVKKGDAYLARGYEGESLLGSTRTWYEMALERRQNYAPALRGLGEIEGRLGNIEKAAEYYRRALAQEPNSIRFLNSFAWTLATRSDSKTDPKFIGEAVELAEKAYEQMPADSSVQNTLGVCYYQAGRWADANQKLNESVKSGADVVHNWLFLSMVNWRLGKKDVAREFFTKSVLWKEGKPGTSYAELKKFFLEAEELIGPIDGLAEKISARNPLPTLPTIPPTKPKTLDTFESSVYEIKLDGSTPQKLTSQESYRWVGQPFLSPNGEKMSWVAIDKTSSKPSLFIGQRNGDVLGQIKDLREGIWMNDRTLLVWREGHIAKISEEGEISPSTVVQGVRHALSANQKYLVYQKEQKLYVRDMESGDTTEVFLKTAARMFNRFSISDDGKQLAYVGNGETRGVHVANVNTGDSRLIADEAGSEYWPKFSPDGTQILFTAGDFNVAVGSQLNRIYLANIGAKTTHPVTPEDYHCRDASWAPDGRSIVFVAVERDVVDTELQYSPWLNAQAYQRLFQSKVSDGFYPAEIQGRLFADELTFRAKFIPRPKTSSFAFQAFHGLTETVYLERIKSFQSEGLHEISQHTFADGKGLKRYSGTWLRD